MKRFVKGLIFDYGGTLDTNGCHWAEVIWEEYKRHNVPVSYDRFREAFVSVERLFGRESIIQPYFNFFDTMLTKIKYQFEALHFVDKSIEQRIAEACYQRAAVHATISKILLRPLKEKYPMQLVSNFYGNLPSVLDDFGLTPFFDHVIESEQVKIRKPDPAIFSLALANWEFLPSEVAIIGDSYKNDITPAIELGCQSIWLKGKSFHEEDNFIGHPNIIRDITAVKDYLL